MTNENQTNLADDLWARAKAIYLASTQEGDERNSAERYFSMISRVNQEDNRLTIFATSDYATSFLKTNYAEKLKGALTLAGAPADLSLAFEVDQQAKVKLNVTKVASETHGSQVQKTSSFVSTMPLSPDYTFDEFVRGPSNSFALAAAQGAVKNPGKPMFNPLFIHGGPGLGKTHLMQAIGNELKHRDSSLAICYLTAEVFLNEYVNALQNKGELEFRNKYRSVDVLLLDDVQFLQRGEKVQEEFFNTFNTLLQTNRQIVMTSDVAPRNLPGLQQRLISRFEGGIVQEIESPSYETRLAILKKKAESINIRVPNSVIEFIADNVKSHVRAMEGALGLVSLAINNFPDIILDNMTLGRILKDVIEKEQNLKKITIEEVQNTICKKYSITLDQMLSSERTATLVTPRQLAMYVCRKYTTTSLPKIAEKFDKSHATILHGVKNIEKRLDVEPELKSSLSEILSIYGYKISDNLD